MKRTLAYLFFTLSVAILAVVLLTASNDHDHQHSHDHHGHHHHAHSGHDHHDHHHHEEELIALNEEQQEQSSLEIAIAQNGSLHNTISVPGRVIFNENQLIHIFPKVSGYILQANKNVGEHVYAGELLAVIESREMAEAKAEYLAALKREKLTRRQFEREKTLREKQINSEEEYYNAEIALEESRIALELSKQRLYALKLNEEEINAIPITPPENLRIFAIRSPIDGTIIERHLSVGEFVKEDHEAYTIANLENLWAEISLMPDDLQKIFIGQPIILKGSEGQIAKSEILYLTPTIDPDTRSATAIALISNVSGNWFPGTFLSAEIKSTPIAVSVVIPREAIQYIHGKPSVFIESEHGFRIQPVTIRASDHNQFEINEGLHPGERYVAKNSFILKADHGKEEVEHEH